MSSDADVQPLRASPDKAPAGIRFDVFATRVVYLVVLGLGSVSTTQIDLWWLLRAGQDIWHTGRVSLVERYSHTAAGRYWPNHEWLWEATAYALHHVGGMPLLCAWTGATVATTVWLMRRVTRAEGYVVPLVLAATIPLMSVSWTIRPQVTSMLLFALTMLLLARERYRWIPLVFLLWANLHAQVVMGGLLLAVALVAALVDQLRSRSPESRQRIRRLAVTTAASGTATLFTPLGPRLWEYVLSANGRPGQAQIAEWATAFDSRVGAAIVWPVLALTAVLVVRRRPRIARWEDRVPFLASLAMAPLAVLAIRNIPFLVVAAVPLLMTLLEFRTRRPIGTVAHWRAGLAGFGAVTAAVVVLAWIAAPPRLAWHPVSPALASALRGCPGPLYNNYDDGAALIWWVPDVKVFVDNRQDPYPAPVIDASMGLTAERYQQTFADFGVRCALLPSGSLLVDALHRDGWTDSYEDATSVLLVPSAPLASSATE